MADSSSNPVAGPPHKQTSHYTPPSEAQPIGGSGIPTGTGTVQISVEVEVPSAIAAGDACVVSVTPSTLIDEDIEVKISYHQPGAAPQVAPTSTSMPLKARSPQMKHPIAPSPRWTASTLTITIELVPTAGRIAQALSPFSVTITS